MTVVCIKLKIGRKEACDMGDHDSKGQTLACAGVRKFWDVNVQQAISA